jgi:serine/threonine protein phosphatase PrpC
MAVDFVRQATPRLTTADECARALREMDARISGDPVAGETTCVVVVVRSTGLFGASVGDSGAWLIGSEGFENLTRFQARKPFIGSGVAYPVPFTFAPRPSGMLLLATDGLLKYTSAESICRVCRNSRTGATANELLQLVRLSSGRLPDDTTLILYQL